MKAFKQIMIFISTIILFFLIMLMIFLNSGKSLITKENLADFVKDSEILNIDVNILFNLGGNKITLKEKIKDIGLESGIPEQIVDDILISDEINSILGDFFSKTIDYAINGEKKPKMSDESVKKMQDVASISLENHINIMMEEEELKSRVLNYTIRLTDFIPERNVIVGELPVEELSLLINFNIIYVYIIVVVIVILLGMLTWSIYKPVKYLGITFLISGIIFVILGCMSDFIVGLMDSQVASFKYLIEPLILSILTIWFKLGVLFSFSGVLLITIYIVINRIIINNKNSELEETKRINIEDINV